MIHHAPQCVTKASKWNPTPTKALRRAVYGLPSTELQKLDHIQNSAGRYLPPTHSRDHMTSVLQLLHQLAVQYKFLLTYKAHNNLGRSHLTDLHLQSLIH